MNCVMLCGRLVRDPEIKHSQNDSATSIARFTLAVDRRFRREGEQSADFISCISFGKTADFAEKYLRKGIKIIVRGRISTGSYTNKEGKKVYTTDVVVDEQEFAESKSAGQNYQPQGNDRPQQQSRQTPPSGDEFMEIPDGIDEELPFN